MPRRTPAEPDVAPAQPTSLTELEPIIQEFVGKLRALEHEEETLREEKKELVESYRDRLDTKTLKLALRAAALNRKVEHRDTFDSMLEVLERN